jgi:hypothetical protein
VQILNILRGAIGGVAESNPYSLATLPRSNTVWAQLTHSLADDFGLFRLGESGNALNDFSNYLLLSDDIDQQLDCVEVAFRVVDLVARTYTAADQHSSGVNTGATVAIDRLNARFMEHEVGYQFEEGRIVKVDNQIVHANVILPAIQFLSDPQFAGANQEFLNALDHLRHGRTKEAVQEAAKSVESVLKTICDLKGWTYNSGDNASQLIDNVFRNGLIPAQLQSQFTALRSVLESGTPTVRNRNASHGQGATPTHLPGSMARFALSTAAANIVLLIDAFNGRL